SMLSGNVQCDLSEMDVNRALERVRAADTKEEDVDLRGVFRGATLDTWRFDFRTENGQVISGRLGAGLSSEDAREMLKLIDKPSTDRVHRISVTTQTGTLRTRYALLSLTDRKSTRLNSS